MSHQVFGQPIQQVGVPGHVLHYVQRLHQTTSQQPSPKAVNNGAGQSAILTLRDQSGQLLEPVGLGSLGIHRPQFGKEKLQRSHFPSGFVAQDHFESAIGVDAGQSVGVAELPVIDERIMARGALEVHSHEHLSNVLSGLERWRHGRIDRAPPDNALGKAFAPVHRIDQLCHELVVRLVVEQGLIKPGTDLFAATIDVPGSRIVIAKKIVPEAQPVLGVARFVIKQLPDIGRPLILAAVFEKRLLHLRSRQESGDVQRNSSQEHPIIDCLWHRNTVPRKIRLNKPIHRMGCPSGRQFGATGLEVISRWLSK